VNPTPSRSELNTEINPTWVDADRYIGFLNRVFPGQWNRATYDWYIARTFNQRKSEILIRAHGREILCGMALCYRQVSVGGGKPIEVCVISAAATLPTEQGRGHYATLLGAALEHCRVQGSVALMGFVTRENASGRGLVRLGAQSIPSFYITSGRQLVARNARHAGHSTPVRRIGVERKARLFRAALERRRANDSKTRSSQANFHYELSQDWERQFLERPNAVRVMQLAHDSIAVTETVGTTDRLQWLSCPRDKVTHHIAGLARASREQGRKFFMYSLCQSEARAARRIGLKIRAGYLMLLPTGHSAGDWAQLSCATWQMQSGDRV
jgi:ribosomal protein S18 acetylase RimI-like enzyme